MNVGDIVMGKSMICGRAMLAEGEGVTRGASNDLFFEKAEI